MLLRFNLCMENMAISEASKINAHSERVGIPGTEPAEGVVQKESAAMVD